MSPMWPCLLACTGCAFVCVACLSAGTLVAKASASVAQGSGARALLDDASTIDGGRVSVWLVPLPAGFLSPADYVDSCARLGMRPVCEGGQMCAAADGGCLALQLEQDYCGQPMQGLRKAVRKRWGSDRSLLGDQWHATCNYEGVRGGQWTSGACLAGVDAISYLPGDWLVLDQRRAVCAGDVGGSTGAAVVQTAGRCEVSGDCVTTPVSLGEHPSGYSCLLVALSDGNLRVSNFHTAPGQDVFVVHNQSYSGLQGPAGVHVKRGDALVWTAQVAGANSTWEVCIDGPSKPTAQRLREELALARRENEGLRRQALEDDRREERAHSREGAEVRSRDQLITRLRHQRDALKHNLTKSSMRRSKLSSEAVGMTLFALGWFCVAFVLLAFALFASIEGLGSVQSGSAFCQRGGGAASGEACLSAPLLDADGDGRAADLSSASSARPPLPHGPWAPPSPQPPRPPPPVSSGSTGGVGRRTSSSSSSLSSPRPRSEEPAAEAAALGPAAASVVPKEAVAGIRPRTSSGDDLPLEEEGPEEERGSDTGRSDHSDSEASRQPSRRSSTTTQEDGWHVLFGEHPM